MYRFFSFALICFLLTGCTRSPAQIAAPTIVPISDANGTTIANQPGPLWVLLSGVDEHGLLMEQEISLLSQPDPAAAPGPVVPTGTAAAVMEIQQGGPQNLQRFYHVQTITGFAGWVSDYYIRRVAYLYNAAADTVPLYDAPDGAQTALVPNVTPVTIQQPTDNQWWLVQLVGEARSGWVQIDVVKESPEWEFLHNLSHEH